MAPPDLLRWNVVFSSFLATRHPIRSYDGFLYLRPMVKRLTLLDGEGAIVDARFLKAGESISSGMDITFPCHRVQIGDQDLDLPPLAPSRSTDKVTLMASPSLDLHPGLDIQQKIWRQFHCPVAYAPGQNSAPFFLVASFGRSSVCLDSSTVSSLLHACLGGIAEDLNVEFLRDRSYSRYHVSGAINLKHEDLAIADITPAILGDQPFALTRLFLRDLIEDQLGFSLEITQRCALGSAYVRLSSPSDRDWLVSNSPHPFQGWQVSFVEDNKGINHRSFTYNRECWIMLLSFPADLWDDEHIRGAVKEFGALISWDKEASSYAALIANVQVVSLESIPHSCVISHGNGMHAESWSVPVYILSQKLLGGGPADEDAPPADGSTPHPLPDAHFQPAVPDHPVPPSFAGDWPIWQPAAAVSADGQAFNQIGQNLQHILGHHGFDLNNVPLANLPDLNDAPHQLNQEEFLELQDLLQPMGNGLDNFCC
ncbi:hypothetical protein ACQ4PT_000874 [Festuca glaucescens]